MIGLHQIDELLNKSITDMKPETPCCHKLPKLLAAASRLFFRATLFPLDLLTRGGAGALTPRRIRGPADSDDDASETSSISGSERSFGSIPRTRGNEVSWFLCALLLFFSLVTSSWDMRWLGSLVFSTAHANHKAYSSRGIGLGKKYYL